MKFILMYDFLHEVGGLEKLMAIHAEYLKKEGYKVEILFSDIDRDILNKNPIYNNFKVIEYGKIGRGIFRIIFALLGLNKLRNVIKPEDIIISYSFPVNYTIQKLNNKKITYLNHFPNFLYLPFKERMIWANDLKRKLAVLSSFLLGSILKKIDKSLINKSDLLFVNDYFTKKRLDKIYNIKGVVSYPPVSADIKCIKDKKIHSKYDVEGKKFIFTSGRIIPDKKIDWLIMAFSKLHNENNELLIAGQIDRKQKIKMENLIKRLKLENRVKLLGIIPKEDLIKLYSTANLCAFSAPGEDFGLVPAEAISCGTPCVVWGDGSGPNEIIKDGFNGLYAKPYSIEDFSEKLEIGLDKKWNKNNILRSSKKFSEKEICKNFIKNIKNLL